MLKTQNIRHTNSLGNGRSPQRRWELHGKQWIRHCEEAWDRQWWNVERWWYRLNAWLRRHATTYLPEFLANELWGLGSAYLQVATFMVVVWIALQLLVAI